ncbi:MAG: hypothetical protein HKN77_07260 [Woeseiaceae bacterium]|nr:hypothetical protein [Woeseiaceae bacterium]
MQDHVQKQILDALLVVLRPIAKILLRYGIGYREFAETSKSAFVDVATREYGIRGRPTNISRVAVMTGLTRKEVRRLRDHEADETDTFQNKTTPLATVLHRWFSEDDFLDSAGRPAVLPFSGDSGSFTQLVKKYGGDIPPGAMRTELKRVNAIEENDDGSLRAVRRDIHPSTEYDTLCMALTHAAYPLLANIAHNTDPNRQEGTWVESTAFTADIRLDDVPRLRRICNDRAKEAVESFDDLFGAYEKLNEGDSSTKNSRPVAVGIFYFEERDEKSYPLWESKSNS